MLISRCRKNNKKFLVKLMSVVFFPTTKFEENQEKLDNFK